ncbi:hypothetical protein HDU76_012265, partial [Blyttiomyces sp. JEL0837]
TAYSYQVMKLAVDLNQRGLRFLAGAQALLSYSLDRQGRIPVGVYRTFGTAARNFFAVDMQVSHGRLVPKVEE